MAVSLSRRGLFRAFRHTPDATNDTGARVAHISQACVEPRGITCRRCGDECAASAIRFRPQGRGVFAVTIDAERCTGCGDCLPVCPAAAMSLVSAERIALMAAVAEINGASQ